MVAVIAVAALALFAGCSRPQSSEKPATTQVKEVTYTCPMHPEVISNKPGKCPKCGMNLELVKPKEEKKHMPSTTPGKATKP
jgi:hypothetical protein